MPGLDQSQFEAGPAGVYVVEALSGTITTTSGDATVSGSGTAFDEELAAGDVVITAGGERLTVLSITSATELEATANASGSETGVAATAEKNIGYTGSVTVDIEGGDAIDLMGEQAGTTVLDKVISGAGEVSISLPIRQMDLVNLKRVILNTGTVTESGSKKKLQVQPRPGTKLSTIAKKMILKPYSNGVEVTDQNEWITAPKAAPTNETISIPYDNSGQREVAAKFICLPDSSNSNAQLIFGDDTI